MVPMFFAQGLVDLQISLDSGSTWNVTMQLKIMDLPARLTTSLDNQNYIISHIHKTITLTWAAKDFGESTDEVNI